VKDISGYFRRLVQEQLPDDARILASFAAGDVIIQATWRLRNDARHPGKRSPLIRIVITVAAVEEYVRRSDELRAASERRFVAWLQSRLAAFDPDDEASFGAESARVDWTVNGDTLNG
jgi:hypothetical protein